MEKPKVANELPLAEAKVLLAIRNILVYEKTRSKYVVYPPPPPPKKPHSFLQILLSMGMPVNLIG